MHRRSAVTLIEALMAIFVMAIGLLALLTLFPLGAFTMAQALKDQRTVEAANTATADFKAFQLQNDPVVQSPGFTIAQGGSGLPVFQDPWPQAFFPNPNVWVPPLATGTSYPLYIDPLYFQADLLATNNNTIDPPWALNRSLGIPVPAVNLLASQIRRCTPTIGSVLPATPASPMRVNPTRWCTLQDDIYFADNGAPDLSGGNIPREGRYTYAYLVRRAAANSADLPLDLTVVVYSGAEPGPDVNGNPTGEPQFNASFGVTNTPGVFSNRSILLTWAPLQQAPPKVRRGTWLLDARMTGVTANGTPFVPQGYFYRVTNVSDVSSDGFLEVEVQAPGGGTLPIGYYTTQQALQLQGTVIVMDNVSEVFARGTNY